MEKLFKKIEARYDLEDIIGFLGGLLADDSSFDTQQEREEAIEAGYDFLRDIYNMATSIQK